MYRIFVEDHFSAAHRLRHYKGKCERVHGHNWKIRVFVSGMAPDPQDGMIMDFGLLKGHLREVLSLFDHQDLNALELFATEEPSAENIARIVFQAMAPRIDNDHRRVSQVMVWESEASCAIYEE